jgi:hypothetical protein
MICDLKTIGIGYFSRQGAKALRLWGKVKNVGKTFPPLISELCGLSAFAGDIPKFGCGAATLGPSWLDIRSALLAPWTRLETRGRDGGRDLVLQDANAAISLQYRLLKNPLSSNFLQ